MTPASMDKWRYSFYSLFIFFLVSNPYTYKITNSLSPIKTTLSLGCPTFFGLCLHGLVFLLIIRYIMDLNL